MVRAHLIEEGMDCVHKLANEDLRSRLSRELGQARALTDSLFDLVQPRAITDRPIRERHRIIFYLGHLEVFDWNMIGRQAFGFDGFHSEFDQLFAFGIDPMNGSIPQDSAEDWPKVSEIQSYKAQLRSAIDECLARAD